MNHSSFKRRSHGIAGVISLVLLGAQSAAIAASPRDGIHAVDGSAVAATFEEHCFGCHGYGSDEGGLNFETLAAGEYGEETTAKWEAVWKNLRSQTMPPAEEERPPLEWQSKSIDWIGKEVFKLDPNHVDPGHVVLRRLSRSEYKHTIHEVLGVSFRPSEEFPADDTGYGFDTIGEVLNLSPMLLEKYFAAAETVVNEFMPYDGPNEKGQYPKPASYKLYSGPPPADANDAQLREHVRKEIASLGIRIYRRPLDEQTLDRLTGFATDRMAEPGKRYEHGLAVALKAMLSSPRFLFRADVPLMDRAADGVAPIDEFSLATRLSYFLWARSPDDTLLQLAREGKLREQLDAQVDRMIDKDYQFAVGAENFVGQWLQTRDIADAEIDVSYVTRKDRSSAYGLFNGRHRDAMARETNAMFQHIVTADRPIAEFLYADYTFLNKYLLKHYELPADLKDVDGKPVAKSTKMVRAQLPEGSHRGGLLRSGSMLLVTSNPTRTSPVKRGLFILENILGTPAPPAPANVPELEEAGEELSADATLRQTLEAHRKNPECAGCHARMDPLGLALENYDAIGRYRDETLEVPKARRWKPEPAKPIDPSGRLMTGESFGNADEMARILATDRRRDFTRCLTEKMLTYALGRGLTYRDGPTIDAIVDEVEASGGSARTLIKAIVKSKPFTHMRVETPGQTVAQSN